jgi:hypothetical protein
VSLKPFPDIIRNGMHKSEMSLFDNSCVDYVQDKPRPIDGGAYNMKNSLPYAIVGSIHSNNDAVRKACDDMDTFLKHVKDTNIIHKPHIPLSSIEYKVRDPLLTTQSKFRKTRKNSARNGIRTK